MEKNYGQFYLLPITHGAEGLMGLNLVKCGTRIMFGVSDDISPQGERPTFISIVRNKAYNIGSTMLRLTIKHISLDSVNELSECVRKLIMRDNCKVFLA